MVQSTTPISQLPLAIGLSGNEFVPLDVPNGDGTFTTKRIASAVLSVAPSGTLPIAFGGTGASTAPTALAALGGTSLTAVQSLGYVTTAGAASAAPVQTVAGRTGAVSLSSSDLSDVTATGTSLVTAATPAAARAVIGIGTVATQNANAVTLTGGAVDGTVIGSTTPSSGRFTSLISTGNPQVAGTAVQQLGRNLIINGNFRINQRAYASGAALAANAYGHDRWKASVAGSYTFSQASAADNTAPHAIDTAITVPAGMTVAQPVESSGIEGGTFCLSWAGTATGSVTYYDGSANQTALTPGVSGRSFTLPSGVTVSVSFSGGTLGTVQLERGSVSTPFEREARVETNRRCLRYYQAFAQGTAVLAGYATAGSTIGFNFLLPVTMRSAPTFAFVGSWTATNVSGSPGQTVSSTSLSITLQASAAGMVSYNAPANGGFTLDAEL